jgi:hypothetical protein
MIRALAVLAMVASGTVACHLGPDLCTLEISPAVELDIRHAGSGLPAWLDVAGEVIDGPYRDSLIVPPIARADSLTPALVIAAVGRPGTYAVHVERPGFAPWDTTGIVVSRSGGSCPQLFTARLVVALEPVP